jgi:hypothetical protein
VANAYDPDAKKRPVYKYLDIVRCGGRTSRLAAKKKNEKPKKKSRSYAEARGAIHQLLNIILKLRILVLLPVSTLPYIVKVKNHS